MRKQLDNPGQESCAVPSQAGTKITYDWLVVSAGIQVNWDQFRGLKESIGKDGVCSNYSFEYVDSTWENIRNFKGGTALFTQPSGAVKCGGAPQKIMYLAEDSFCRSGVHDKSNECVRRCKSAYLRRG